MAHHSSRHKTVSYRWPYVVVGSVVIVLAIVLIVISREHPVTHKDVAEHSTHPVTRLSLNGGQSFPWNYKAYGLDGQMHLLHRGKRATIVVMMASWCKFCAYDDKYVWPVLMKTPGVVVDIIDVSPNGGIGDPGPFSPPFDGSDHFGKPISPTGMISVMREYRVKFHLTAPNVAIYVDPEGLERWPIKYFPTIAFINGQGNVSQTVNGGLLLSQAQGLLQATL